MPPTPLIKSFLVADSVIQDRATGKWTVVGVFDHIYAPQFPCYHPSLGVYLKLADALGRYRVRIEFRDEQDRCVSTFEGLDIDVTDRGKCVDFGVNTHMLPLERPGKYRFQLYLGDEHIADVPLQVMKLPPKPPPPRE